MWRDRAMACGAVWCEQSKIEKKRGERGESEKKRRNSLSSVRCRYRTGRPGVE